jgi:ribosome recycling factor
MANITAQEARLLVIQPWERNQLGPIEKAILKSDLGLTPTNDGNTVRLSIPPLTEERRHELVKLVRKRVENGRISVRNIRRDAQDAIRSLEREKAISQDEMARAREQLQKLTDASVEQANSIGQDKEAEVLEV